MHGWLLFALLLLRLLLFLPLFHICYLFEALTKLVHTLLLLVDELYLF